ncbi:MAG: 2-oxoacid:ferredoxin oxidoreductase subunit beta [Chloroflexi bacterium]|nr:2-oxoacid:ferredoxin oxidoreductase subunit beta [Chloroflexota bacterium]MBU1750677.1 2-oxoacid:ferredoxin oxidoreductase subunit beta [Chloroflexota bacterium]
MVELQNYAKPRRPTWCPGCGDFGIWNAIKRALLKLELAPHQAIIYTGIGCGSKLPDYMTVNGFTSIHGRPIPVAQGAHLANHGLKAIVVAGDGDTYGIGGNHLMHALRRNADIAIMVQDNRVYGLTKGQYSPTSPQGFKTKTSPPPAGAIDRPVNPIALAMGAGATFVARAWSGDLPHLIEMMMAAIRHRGAALLDILQPCVTFNPDYAYDFYRERVYVLEENGYHPTDRAAAWAKAHEWGDRISIGVIYRVEDRPSYEEQVPALEGGPLIERGFREWTAEDYAALEAEFV